MSKQLILDRFYFKIHIMLKRNSFSGILIPKLGQEVMPKFTKQIKKFHTQKSRKQFYNLKHKLYKKMMRMEKFKKNNNQSNKHNLQIFLEF